MVANKMWYTNSLLLSYNNLFNFVMGNRGGGKTFDSKNWCIRDFIKKGAMFIWVRRYKTELDECLDGFFADIQFMYPNEKLEVKGRKFYINDKLAGYAVALSVSSQLKSKSYPLVDKIIFDEYVIATGVFHYLKNEVTVFLEFYETVNRMKDNVRAMFVANAISVVNPYFLYWNIKPNLNKRFTKNGQITIEFYKSQEFIDAKNKTRFGQLVAGTKYGQYAIENEFLEDNDVFIGDKTSKAEFMLGTKYNGKMYGFWVDYKEGFIYANEQYDPSSYNLYAITKNDHEPNLLLIKSLASCKPIQRIVYAFQNGLLQFSNMQVKNQFYEFIQYFMR